MRFSLLLKARALIDPTFSGLSSFLYSGWSGASMMIFPSCFPMARYLPVWEKTKDDTPVSIVSV